MEPAAEAGGIAALETENARLRLELDVERAATGFGRGLRIGLVASVVGLALAGGFLFYIIATFRMPGG